MKRLLCAENRIDGVIKNGRLYMIPINAPKPIDARTMKGISISQKFVPLFLKMQLFKLD